MVIELLDWTFLGNGLSYFCKTRGRFSWKIFPCDIRVYYLVCNFSKAYKYN